MPRPPALHPRADLLKAGALIFDKQKRLLLCREFHQHIWMFVGGRLETHESPLDALYREVCEELSVDVIGTPKLYYTSHLSKAATMPTKTIKLYIYLTKIASTPHAANEIAELHWLSREEYQNKSVPLTDTLQDEVIPKLIKDKLF